MCGIVGYVGKKACGPILLSAIRKLEYRGYDSVGMASVDGSLKLLKDVGKIEEVQAKLRFDKLTGNVGIAHTRWSTHGIPSQRNAHPFLDCAGELAVVHNGIIENFSELRKKLEARGHTFSSDTDTEVFAHLIEEELRGKGPGDEKEKKLAEAVRSAIVKWKVRGSWAIAAISQNEPDRIVVARNLCPLVIGIGNGEYFVASDIPAFLDFTREFVPLMDGEIAVVTPSGISISDLKGKKVVRPSQQVDWTPEMARREGYPHFMLKEIHEQPLSLRQTLSDRAQVEPVASYFRGGIHIVACGTSYHAGIAGKYVIEKLAGIPVEVTPASEFEQPHYPLLAISQSGETADTLKVLRSISKKVHAVAMTNVVGSTITRESDSSFFTRSGPEIGVAATKTFTSQVLNLYLLGWGLSGSDPKILREINSLPQKVSESLELESQIKEISKWLSKSQHVYFIGRGPSLATALEGSLKLKEISYIHAEGMAAGELKHGTLALVEKGIPVVVICPPGENYDRTISNLMEVKARGGKIIALGHEKDKNLKSLSDYFIGLPEVNELFSCLVYIIPLQLLAYYCGLERGCDPDKPRNLAKSVTVE